MPRVDVVIPCYRYGRFLRGCVASVLEKQGSVDVRALIIDDASGDGSAEIARSLAASDRRIETIVHAKNRGHIATYNEGIAWASGDYFLLLSADDLVTPGALERAVAVMERNPGLTLSHGREIELHGGAEPPVFPHSSNDGDWSIRSGADLIEELCRSTINRIRTSTAVVRMAAQKAVGGYRPSLPHAGDIEMWLRLATLGDVAETQAVQGIRRVHGSNMSFTDFASDVADFRQLRAAFDSFFANEGHTINGSRELARLARSNLADRMLGRGLYRYRHEKSRDGLRLAMAAAATSPGAAWRLARQKLAERVLGRRATEQLTERL